MPDRYEFPFKQNYLDIDGQRMHYVDEGSGPVVLLMHGEPTWSYLYRKMIPPLVAAGYRCIVPDLIGFGLSSKPEDESYYTLKRHVAQISELIGKLKLQDMTVVGQDWGGPIGLGYAIENKTNIRSLVILNTLVAPMLLPGPFRLLFTHGGFSSFLIRRLDLMRKAAFMSGFHKKIDSRVKQQYLAPHPTPASRAGVAAFPKLVPGRPNHVNYDYMVNMSETLKKWDLPVLVMFSDKDIAFKVADGQNIAKMVPNGRFIKIRNAGHFLQEDAGEELADNMIEFLGSEVWT
ncbi:MAG: alpha/beta fold hydrolase [Rhizobiales bacterium]|nr:alpha/beta fold hydrolase [Hyphomicrobiales bacterium]NRB15525.1 alpha/beta fold hydrolase [Hyphomicrobiales bacterium]